MNDDNINDYIPSLLNPRAIRKRPDFSLTQNSNISRCSLSLKRPNKTPVKVDKLPFIKVNLNKENIPNESLIINESPKNKKQIEKIQNFVTNTNSLAFSAIEDLLSLGNSDDSTNDFGFNNLNNSHVDCRNLNISTEPKSPKAKSIIGDKVGHISIRSRSSATDLITKSESTLICYKEKPIVKLSFGVSDCDRVHVNTKNGAIKNFSVYRKDKDTIVDCELLESSQNTTETEVDENMNETFSNPLPQKRPGNVAVNLEIKKRKLTQDVEENSKVLILNTNAIERISHVIIQPPNYIFVKRNISQRNKYKKCESIINNGNKIVGAKLRQVSIESFIRKGTDANIDVNNSVTNNGEEGMSKNSGIYDALKCDREKSSRTIRRDAKSARLPSTISSPKRPDIKTTNSDSPSPRVRNDSASSHSPRRNVESILFNLPIKSKSNKTSLSPRNIPHHKIVAGTHFAVDAFSYGEIPNVKHYFLTHFHSDHYSGLKKGFNKLLFCSKITADLCISRLGISPKTIHIINVDETIRIDSVEIAAVDANHCPGAVMFVFTLPNGKTLLHTGDFRASPAMESYPVFWNKDIHTIYLDTTYCNPRYDFPTQEQSLEMALYILRQKKMALEKVGKKFSSVLIVCGTYTIGKEKFFLGMSRRVGCAVWACPEKERVLQTVEGRASRPEPPHACQLHVVPMRDLTHEKLHSYLDSLQGAFSEVVAFKPSGWENGKNSSVEKDMVTIHGIPYSEHSSFSELIRFVKFLSPKQVVPTVDISGGIKAVQKYFPCPLVYKDDVQQQARVTDYFSIHSRPQISAVT